MNTPTTDTAARATPCGWTCTDGGGENYVYETNPCWAAKYPDRWLPVYSAATVAALEEEVRELTADRDTWQEQASDRVADWDKERQRADAAERRVAELEREANSVIEFLSHFASVAANSDDTFAETVMNGVTELTNTIEKERERGLKVQEAAESIDGSWDALMDTQQVIPVSITKLRALRAAITGARAK